MSADVPRCIPPTSVSQARWEHAGVHEKLFKLHAKVLRRVVVWSNVDLTDVASKQRLYRTCGLYNRVFFALSGG